MPIIELAEAKDLDEAIERLLRARGDDDALRRLQEIFVERLDFVPRSGLVGLSASGLPSVARRVAERDGSRLSR